MLATSLKLCSSARHARNRGPGRLGATFGITPAHAVGNCGAQNPNRHNYHIGWQKNPARGQVYGASATLTVQSSTLCTMGNPIPYLYTYTMVDQPNTGGPLGGWDRAGYQLIQGGVTVDFAQMNRGLPGDNYISYVGMTHRLAGDIVAYKAQYLDSCTCLKAYVQGVEHLTSTGWNPKTVWGTTGWQFEDTSEANYRESDVPGVVTAKNRFSSMQYLTSVLSWTDVDCNATPLMVAVNNSVNGHWAQDTLSCTDRRTWTATP
jgi:hypothetical protein